MKAICLLLCMALGTGCSSGAKSGLEEVWGGDRKLTELLNESF